MADLLLDQVASASVGSVPVGAVDIFPDSGSLVAGQLTMKRSGVPLLSRIYEGAGPTPWYDVTAYGAKGDGTTDDTSAINAAIAAAVALALPAGQRGSVVYFPQGIYFISSALTTPVANGIIFRGAGRGASTILVATAFATGDVLAFSSGKAFCEVRDLQFFAQGTRSSGAFVNTNGSHDVIVSDCVLTGAFQGIAVTGGSIKVIIRNTEVNSTVGATGVGILVNNGSAGDTYIGPGIIMSNGTPPLAGIQILASGHCSILEVNVTRCVNGLLINPGAGQIVNYLFVDHALFDSCSGNGININATTATSIIESMFFVNSWAAGTTAGGGAGLITQGAVGGIIDGLKLIACRFLNNQTHGIQHGFGARLKVMGGVCAGNSQASSGVSDGINVAANLNNFHIIGVTIGVAGTSQVAIQKWGINIQAGTSNNYIVSNNDLTGQVVSATGGSIFDGGVPAGLTQKIVDNNVGGIVKGGVATTTAPSGAINTTATVVAGGANSGAVFPANSLRVGTVIRVTMPFACTATVANAQTWTLRFGVNGTTADAAFATVAVTSAASGSGILAKAVIEFVVTVIGTTGTTLGNLTLHNTGITGAATNNITVVALTPTATLNTTVTNYLTVSFVTAATTTTDTFSAPCLVEVVKP